MTFGRLPCCQPSTYDATSSTVVHRCDDRYEEPLTPAEMAAWRLHPAGANGGTGGGSRRGGVGTTGPGSGEAPPVATDTPATSRRRRDVWHTGPNHCPECSGWEE